MKRSWLWTLLAAVLLAAPAQAQEKDREIHDELRAVRDEMKKAFEKRDLDALLAHCDPDVVVTWQDGTVCKGRDELRKYYKEKLLDPNSTVKELTIKKLEVTDFSRLTGKDKETAIAYGTMDDHYVLRDGMEFNLGSHWTCTLIKDKGKWVIVNAHLSANTFYNEVMWQAVKKTMLWFGGGGALIGLLVGIVGTVIVKRRRASAPPAAPGTATP
jgi:ketosteroid isomerase-like protein